MIKVLAKSIREYKKTFADGPYLGFRRSGIGMYHSICHGGIGQPDQGRLLDA